MSLARGGTHFLCPYCASIQFVADSSGTGDGVVVDGDQTELTCPICSELLATGTIDGLPIWSCRRCHGVLARNGDFGAIVKRRRAQRDPERESTPAPVDPDELRRSVRCPQCARKMETHPYYGPGSVVIDSCANCFLVWLDHGEIGLIQNAPGR